MLKKTIRKKAGLYVITLNKLPKVVDSFEKCILYRLFRVEMPFCTASFKLPNRTIKCGSLEGSCLGVTSDMYILIDVDVTKKDFFYFCKKKNSSRNEKSL